MNCIIEFEIQGGEDVWDDMVRDIYLDDIVREMYHRVRDKGWRRCLG